MHDLNYKRMFSFPRMVADLLRAVCDAELVAGLDLARLERLSTDYVGERGQERLGDCVWRVPFRDGWLYLLVLLEFQSTKDAVMALRNLEYTALLYTELGRTGKRGNIGEWPPVLPLVLYNGDTPWPEEVQMRRLIAPTPAMLEPFQPSQRSLVLDERHIALDDLPLRNLMCAVAGLEQSRTAAELANVTAALQEWLSSPSDTELGRAFAAWIQEIASEMAGAPVEPGKTLEDTSMSLVERAAGWREEWRREGRAEGRREGLVEALQLIAEQQFGRDVASRVVELLAPIDDVDRLGEVMRWVNECRSGDELIARVAGIGNGSG